MRVAFLILFVFHFSNKGKCQLSVHEEAQPVSFPLVTSAGVATIVCDSPNDSLVQKVSRLFGGDIRAVTGIAPPLQSSARGARNIVLIGNMNDSKMIGQLVKAKRLNLKSLHNGWETFLIQVVSAPFAGVDQALVIAGSDRRGTAYGVLELSQKIGVSPLHWWANVPAKKKRSLYVTTAAAYVDAPKIRYRGIFINDEAPALSSWSREKFGGFNHLFYEKVFELLLRLKANYLWPAMWGSAFYDDDTLNKKTADDWGIVIGTSHHEPLMRAHDEWRRYGSGKWSYDSNQVRLKEFWKAGLQRATNEKIVTIGMRGDGDEPMSAATATHLLERIVADQRAIIEQVTGKPAKQTPQLWALYKEVQDYYDKGMRVPDDVTLLLCDDNWGNIRRLPQRGARPRKGGYGIYYHFDYVGGPRNYKWLNTNNIARVWEQMHLAYAHGAREIWIVNVGDIKPMELPLSFFLDHAWNPERWNTDNVHQFYARWAEQQFGKTHAREIGTVLGTYAQYSARIKPELLSHDTYHLEHYDEAERVKAEHAALEQKAEGLYRTLSAAYKDAYYDLVLHPVKALANLVNLYNAVAWNRYYAAKGDTAANSYADKAKIFYEADSLLTIQYHSLAGGKWSHIMDQTHIGYTYWQQPERNVMPAVS
ncbi:MAG TPA: glycosyl hydrolase 115 family protein, partial [Flavisolibacter sp.]|nr:glycosyl hydrolase 115 family protein [Flavisolibacter sp.]